MSAIKNIAIIAHVDHGKTTLVDQLLEFCTSISDKEKAERVLDSGDLERERGITITAKNTAVEYKDVKINIVDTPGHSDFGGEVERILAMVDTCLLLVDAREGPMPQTRFVLNKALEMGHNIILAINKIDRPNIEVEKVIEDTFELFLELNASDQQIEFPIVYCSAKEGYAMHDMADEKKDISPLLDVIIDHTRDNQGEKEQPFRFQVTTLDYDDYLGRLCIGKVFSGQVKTGDEVMLWGENGEAKKHRVTKLFSFLGLQRIEAEVLEAGDIVAIAGIPELTIGDSLLAADAGEPFERIQIEPPTVSMLFKANDSPMAGRDGKMLTSRQIKARLERELMTNLSLRVEIQGESFKVSGRGELHLAILIETMRREGFELGVSKPEVIYKEVDGSRHEPFEEVILDMPEEHSGAIIQDLNRRKGQMTHIQNISDNYVRLTFEIPTRGIIGFRGFFLTETRGNGTMSGIFLGYRPFAGDFESRKRGAMISMVDGVANTYALFNLQERGELFIKNQTPVYEGMVIGLNAKDNDLEVNPIKEKKLSNVRAAGSDDALKLTPPRPLSLEAALELLSTDEILEITPENLRIRKKILKASDRKRARV